MRILRAVAKTQVDNIHLLFYYKLTSAIKSVARAVAVLTSGEQDLNVGVTGSDLAEVEWHHISPLLKGVTVSRSGEVKRQRTS